MTEGYNLGKVDFLVVDDNAHMRKIVRQILSALHAQSIREADDGASALRELQTSPTDIVITDWNMDPLDGLEFTKMVRTSSDSPNPFVPIIMLTGHTEMHKVIQARDAGINEFLAKPVSSKDLYDKIASVIANPRAFIQTKNFFGPDRRRRSGITHSFRRQQDFGTENERLQTTQIAEGIAGMIFQDSNLMDRLEKEEPGNRLMVIQNSAYDLQVDAISVLNAVNRLRMAQDFQPLGYVIPDHHQAHVGMQELIAEKRQETENIFRI